MSQHFIHTREENIFNRVGEIESFGENKVKNNTSRKNNSADQFLAIFC